MNHLETEQPETAKLKTDMQLMALEHYPVPSVDALAVILEKAAKEVCRHKLRQILKDIEGNYPPLDSSTFGTGFIAGFGESLKIIQKHFDFLTPEIGNNDPFEWRKQQDGYEHVKAASHNNDGFAMKREFERRLKNELFRHTRTLIEPEKLEEQQDEQKTQDTLDLINQALDTDSGLDKETAAALKELFTVAYKQFAK